MEDDINTKLNLNLKDFRKAMKEVEEAFTRLQEKATIKISVETESRYNNRFQKFIKKLFRIV